MKPLATGILPVKKEGLNLVEHRKDEKMKLTLLCNHDLTLKEFFEHCETYGFKPQDYLTFLNQSKIKVIQGTDELTKVFNNTINYGGDKQYVIQLNKGLYTVHKGFSLVEPQQVEIDETTKTFFKQQQQKTRANQKTKKTLKNKLQKFLRWLYQA